MKIALYSSFFPSANGGARFTQVLTEFLIREGHDVTVVTPTALGPHDELPYPVVRRPTFSRMVEIARRADIVHSNGISIRAISATVASGQRPIVSHGLHTAICPAGSALGLEGRCTATFARPGPCSSCSRRDRRAHIDMALWRTGVKVAKANVCVSRYAVERLGLPHSTMIYNPVDPRAFFSHDLGAGEDGLVAFVGRLDPYKGLGLLMRAISLVPEARLEVMGGPPSLLGRWEEEARTCGIAGRVKFVGSMGLDQILDLYARAAVVCVPSIYEETFGYAVAESMAAGRAVVATPRGAFPELLGEERGFVSGSLAPIDLAHALRKALEDPGLKSAAEQRARHFAETNFDVAAVGKRHLDLYRRTSSGGVSKQRGTGLVDNGGHHSQAPATPRFLVNPF
jgi:glycosyltransferase involved in cell wall biosynthesis